jgi:hypothetical protein
MIGIFVSENALDVVACGGRVAPAKKIFQKFGEVALKRDDDTEVAFTLSAIVRI